jgi:hypothetical protein
VAAAKACQEGIGLRDAFAQLPMSGSLRGSEAESQGQLS